jgi:putative endonuclease
MLPASAASGRLAEDLAHRFLQKQGLRVIARNYRPRPGEAEVDLVALDQHCLVFVEVKARHSAEFGNPDRAIGEDKQKRIVRAARAFTTRADFSWDRVRFDTVAIILSERPEIVHNKDAFFAGRAR